MEYLTEYIIEQALIVVPALIVLGFVIKSTTFLKDKYIPLALLVFGILLSVSLMGFNADAIIQGVLVTGAAVLAHQGYKQTKRGD